MYSTCTLVQYSIYTHYGAPKSDIGLHEECEVGVVRAFVGELERVLQERAWAVRPGQTRLEEVLPHECHLRLRRQRRPQLVVQRVE